MKIELQQQQQAAASSGSKWTNGNRDLIRNVLLFSCVTNEKKAKKKTLGIIFNIRFPPSDYKTILAEPSLNNALNFSLFFRGVI